MYNNEYGPEFLVKPDRVEKLPYGDELLDLEIRTHRSAEDEDYDFIVLFRVIDPKLRDYPAAVGTYTVKDGHVIWENLDTSKEYRDMDFHKFFECLCQALSWLQGFALAGNAQLTGNALYPATQHEQETPHAN